MWQVTLYVVLAYLGTSLLVTLFLLPAYLLDQHSFSGEVPAGFSPVIAIFCMAMGVLSQTAVSISELAPASYYTITVVTASHFLGTLSGEAATMCRSLLPLITASSIAICAQGGSGVGILMGAAVLGVLINRVSIPQARVVFSDNCLLTSRNGVPLLIFRLGNTRGNFLLHPEIRIALIQVPSTSPAPHVPPLVADRRSEATRSGRCCTGGGRCATRCRAGPAMRHAGAGGVHPRRRECDAASKG